VERPLRVRCRRADDTAITVGLPQTAADFAAMPQSAGAGHKPKFAIAPSYTPDGVSRTLCTVVPGAISGDAIHASLRDAQAAGARFDLTLP
jgi:hypothetical protein